MPFSNMGSSIAGFFDRFGDRGFFMTKPHRPAADVVGHSVFRSVLSGHQGRSCRRAHRAGRVAVGKLHA